MRRSPGPTTPTRKTFARAFAGAWFKLTHRDMGPITRYHGPEVPVEPRTWMDPMPPVDHPLVDAQGIALLKERILGSGLSVARLVKTAWASAASLRGFDKRGGANGTRVRLAPQTDWPVNEPAPLAETLARLGAIADQFNAEAEGGRKVSLADMIVVGGCAAVEEAARRAGHTAEVPFTPGRTDATEAQTDADSFAPLEPVIDGFRNRAGNAPLTSLEEMLVDQAQLLTLAAPERTVLMGGLRVLGRQPWRLPARRDHRPGRNPPQRFLLQPARRFDGAPVGGGRGRQLGRPGPDNGQTALDGNPGRPHLRLELAAARAGRGPCLRRGRAAVHRGVCGGLGEGDRARPVRPAPLTPPRAPARIPWTGAPGRHAPGAPARQIGFS